MKSSPGRKLAVIGAVVVVLAVAAARLDVPRIAGPIKGDEATYVAMAFSVAKDFDLKYRPEDYRRFLALYGTGPEGIFLKRSAGSPAEYDYGKAFAYPLLAAPFAGLMGLGGLLLLNLVLLGMDVWCAALFCRARTGRRVAGSLIGIAFVAASVVPIYAVWLTPELFNFSLVLMAYFLWLYKEVAPADAPAWLKRPSSDWIAAALIGVATFSKPTHAPLIAPIVVTMMWRQQWARGLGIGTLFLLVGGGLYGVNALVTGEWNYQGGAAGARRYFVTHFPFDAQNTPFEAGNSMTTNEATDQGIVESDYVARTLPKNVFYFLVGRHAGLLPYFFPGALIALLWVVRARRAPIWQWLTAGAAMVAVAALLVLGPDIWNGGGGPIGNRYFLSLYPALLFLLPAHVGLPTAVIAGVVGLICVGPIVARPFVLSRSPWLVPERWPLRLLPIELTILNQLPVALNQQRFRVPVSRDPEVFLYYMDGRTYFQEKDGFWVAPGTAEIIIRTERPLTALRLTLKSPIDNHIAITVGGKSWEGGLSKDSEVRVQLSPAPGWFALQSYQVIWRITTARGFYPKDLNAAATDARQLGVFISPAYEVR